MSEALARQAGGALLWRALQLLGSRIISLLRTLVLAALLVPEDFGLMAIAAVAISLLMSLTELGMVQALVQRREPRADHYHAAWTVRALRAVTVTSAVVILAPWIAAAFGEPEAVNILRALAFRPLLDGLGSIKVAALTRSLRFRPLALKGLTAAIVEAVTAIALASTLGVWALVVGALAGAAADTLISYVVAPYRPRPFLRRETAASLFRFGRWIFLTAVLSVLGGASLRMIISRVVGVSELGLFYLAANVALLPNDTLSHIVGEVLFPVHARLKTDAGRAAKAFQASLVSLLALLAPIYAIMIVLAPSMVRSLLPAQWLGTERIIQLIAITGVVGVVVDAAGPMLEGRGQPQRVSFLFGLRTLLILVLALPLSHRYGLIGATTALVAAEIAVQLVATAQVRQAIGKPFAGLAPRALGIALCSLAGAGAAVVVDSVGPGLLGFVVAATVGLGLAFGLLWLMDRRRGLGLAADLRQLFPQVERLLPGLFATVSPPEGRGDA